MTGTIQLDAVNRAPQQLLAVLLRRGWGGPDRRQVLRQRTDRRALLGRQIPLSVGLGLRMRLLELGDTFQFLIPAPLELTRHQPIIRVDAFILPLCETRVVPRLF